MNTDVEVEGNTPFETFDRRRFDIFTKEGRPTGALPPNPDQVSNDRFWGGTEGQFEPMGYVNIATVFFDFRDYNDKF